jgi:hypothetical protein
LSLTKFVKWVFRMIDSVKIRNLEPAKPWSRELMKIRNLEPAKPRSREPVKIRNLEPAKPWSREPVVIRNLEPAKPWSREPVKIWNLEPTKPWSHEPTEFWNWESTKFGNLLKIKFGGYGAWRFPWIKDSWISEKPSQRRCLKSPGLTCELVADL